MVRARVRSIVFALAAATLAALGLAAPAHADGPVAPVLTSIWHTPTSPHVGQLVTVGYTSDTGLSWVRYEYVLSTGDTDVMEWNPQGSSASSRGFLIPSGEYNVEYTLQLVLVGRWDGTMAEYRRDGTVVNYPEGAVGPTTHSLDFGEAEFQVAADPPSPPIGLAVSPGDGAAYVSWNPPTADHGTPVTGYTITAQPGDVQTSVDSSKRFAKLAGLENGTEYHLSVIAENAAGASNPASTIGVIPGPGLGPPATPVVEAHAGVNKAKVSWQTPFDGGSPITEYKVTASPGGQTCTKTNASATSCYIEGLTNGVPYTFTTTASNHSGTSDPSAPTDPVTPASDTHAPTLVSATVTPGRVSSLGGTVTVDLHITDDLSGALSTNYVTFRNAANNSVGFGQATRISGDEYDGIYRRTFSVPSGTPIGDYKLSVYPTEDAAGNDGAFQTRPGFLVGTPMSPTNVTSSADGARQVTVDWDAPTDDGGNVITGYEVTASPSGQTYDTTDTSLTTSFASWPADTPVTFTVKAINAAGSSDASNPSAPLTVTAVAPSAPTITDSVPGDRRLGVSWSAPTSNGGAPISSYTATAQPGGAFCTASGDGCLITGLENGTSYTVTVTATNAGGTSPASTPSGPITPFGPVFSFHPDAVAKSVKEGAGSVMLAVVRTGNTGVPASVGYALSGGTATPGADFSIVGDTLSFAAGETMEVITIPIADDAAREAAETIEITLSSPSDGATVASPQTVTATILDDDTAVVSFGVSGVNLSETSGTVQLTVTRSGNTDIPATVDYSRTRGNAAVGADVTFAPGSLSFAPGETSKAIPVTIVNDGTREGEETLTIGLQPGDGDTTLGSIASSVVFIGTSDQQPDAWISTSPGSGYAGNNVYNSTGSGQSKTASARRGITRSFYVRVYNDGNVPNTFTLRGTAASAGSSVKYYSNSANVTTAMRSARGWSATLPPGGFRLVEVRITVLRSAKVRSLKSAKVTATWTGDGTRSDVVKAVAKVAR